jgi:hypothetical protein
MAFIGASRRTTTRRSLMDNDEKITKRGGRRRIAAVAGLLGAGAVSGAILAGTLSASAAEDSSSSTQAAAPGYSAAIPSTANGQGETPDRGQAGGAASVRPDEKQLTGSDAAKARVAALEAVSGGTVYRVETDAGDGEYEAHMTKSDGTPVTVKLDENFNVIKVEDGMGTGDPAPNGQNNTGGGG